ncbi:MAG: superoxide dismutase [Cu-Zn] SodC [Rhodospirillaceae bacterium]
MLRAFLLGAGAAVVAATAAVAAETIVTMNKITAQGVGEAIGTVRFVDAPQGITITPNLKGLPPGEHGFHVHQNPSCAPGDGPNGQPAAGLAAGGHYDPAHTGKHLGPHGAGHKGDLPKLAVADDGTAIRAMTVPNLKVEELRGRSLMIHAGGDNYADQPQPLGGGGARIACGVF